MAHSHEGHSHSHAGADHGHTHEILDGPGSFLGREPPIVEGRDWNDRAFTVGIGGYVLYLLDSFTVSRPAVYNAIAVLSAQGRRP